MLQLGVRRYRPYSQEISDVKQHDIIKEIIKTTSVGIVADITNWASVINTLNASTRTLFFILTAGKGHYKFLRME